MDRASEAQGIGVFLVSILKIDAPARVIDERSLAMEDGRDRAVGFHAELSRLGA